MGRVKQSPSPLPSLVACAGWDPVFRPAELASLAPESFDLETDLPTVKLEAIHAKNRQETIQPLPADCGPVMGDEESSGGWDRTTDTRLMKPLL